MDPKHKSMIPVDEQMLGRTEEDDFIYFVRQTVNLAALFFLPTTQDAHNATVPRVQVQRTRTTDDVAAAAARVSMAKR